MGFVTQNIAVGKLFCGTTGLVNGICDVAGRVV
jgi:hypothetical protein